MSPSDSEQVGEFALIERLETVLRQAGRFDAPEPVVGIGDDAAVLRHGAGFTIQTTDTMVDGIHFRSGHMPWFDIGWKSVVSNQSDIAAMGGTPEYALVTLGVPKGCHPRNLEDVYRGMAAALQKHGGRIAGGDVVSSPVLFITVAMSGSPTLDESGEPVLLTRDSGSPGDLIAVTGPLGGSAGGLAADLREVDSPGAAVLRQFHYRPEPRVADGRLLIELGVRCAMDISDGLAADVAKLAKASGVSARLNAADVPAPPELGECFPEEALEMALTGGEDYELVFAAPHDVMDRALARLGRRARHIGRFIEPDEDASQVTIVDRDGAPLQFERAGWDHLSV